jgi:hypothetical protein
MCGIFGSPQFTSATRDMLPFLGLAMQSRGKDAFGGSNGLAVVKGIGPFTSHWYEMSAQVEGWNGGIFHTRGASVGAAADPECAHPFREEFTNGSGWVIGIHNGCIRNWAALNTKYSRNAPCDSMHLWKHKAEGRSWEELEGSAALAWWVGSLVAPPRLYVSNYNNSSLHVARLSDGGIVFCSELDPIRVAAQLCGVSVQNTFSITQGEVYELCEDGVYTVGEKWSLGSAPTVNYMHNPYLPSKYLGNSTLRGDMDCYKCIAGRKKSSRHLLCQECYDKYFLRAAFTQQSTGACV